MNDPDRDAIFSSTKEVLQILAAPARTQIEFFPGFVCVTDELALDFDHWRAILFANFTSELEPEQIGILNELDAKLASLSRNGANFTEELWTGEALSESGEWESIRRMARRALMAFRWAMEIPHEPECVCEGWTRIRRKLTASFPMDRFQTSTPGP